LVVCVTQADCIGGEVCCGTGFSLPVDMGTCSAPSACQ
jgi:hypothetical protein